MDKDSYRHGCRADSHCHILNIKITGSDPITRAPDKMRICVFHSNLNVKNSIIFGNVRIMYAKHFPDTQLCPVSRRICFVYILMECGLLPIFP